VAVLCCFAAFFVSLMQRARTDLTRQIASQIFRFAKRAAASAKASASLAGACVRSSRKRRRAGSPLSAKGLLRAGKADHPWTHSGSSRALSRNEALPHLERQSSSNA
jgi:hypothetical protein